MTQQRALGLVDAAAARSSVHNLSLTQRVLNAGTDYRTIAQLDSMANVQLLSGAHATGATHALQWASAGNAVSTGGSEYLKYTNGAATVGTLTENSTWRLGGSW
jgi:hypothetical protein